MRVCEGAPGVGGLGSPCCTRHHPGTMSGVQPSELPGRTSHWTQWGSVTAEVVGSLCPASEPFQSSETHFQSVR